MLPPTCACIGHRQAIAQGSAASRDLPQHHVPASAVSADLVSEACRNCAVTSRLRFPWQAAAPDRLPRLLPQRQVHPLRSGADLPAGLTAGLQRTDDALAACSTAPDAPVVVYISKMVAVPTIALPR